MNIRKVSIRRRHYILKKVPYLSVRKMLIHRLIKRESVIDLVAINFMRCQVIKFKTEKASRALSTKMKELFFK